MLQIRLSSKMTKKKTNQKTSKYIDTLFFPEEYDVHSKHTMNFQKTKDTSTQLTKQMKKRTRILIAILSTVLIGPCFRGRNVLMFL